MRTPRPKGTKLLIATIGLATVSYVGCSNPSSPPGNLMAPPEPTVDDHPPGNLMAPPEPTIPEPTATTVGSVTAPTASVATSASAAPTASAHPTATIVTPPREMPPGNLMPPPPPPSKQQAK